MTYWVLRVARWLAQRAPLGLCYVMARLLSSGAWLVMPVQRRNAIENMARVLGTDRAAPEVERKAKAAFANYAYYIADFLRLPTLEESELNARLRFTGWEHIDSALAAGRGLVFVSAHVGNWDLAAAVIARKGYPVNVVAESFQPKRVNDIVQGHRESHGMKVIPLEKSARQVISALRRNEILGLLIDRPSPESGVPVKFFGGRTEVPGGAALLALKTGARVVLGITVRNPDHTYTGLVSSIFDLEPTGDLHADVRLLTQRIMDSMEAFIRQYPEQWFIFRPMWPERNANLAAC